MNLAEQFEQALVGNLTIEHNTKRPAKVFTGARQARVTDVTVEEECGVEAWMSAAREAGLVIDELPEYATRPEAVAAFVSDDAAWDLVTQGGSFVARKSHDLSTPKEESVEEECPEVEAGPVRYRECPPPLTPEDFQDLADVLAVLYGRQNVTLGGGLVEVKLPDGSRADMGEDYSGTDWLVIHRLPGRRGRHYEYCDRYRIAGVLEILRDLPPATDLPPSPRTVRVVVEGDTDLLAVWMTAAEAAGVAVDASSDEEGGPFVRWGPEGQWYRLVIGGDGGVSPVEATCPPWWAARQRAWQDEQAHERVTRSAARPPRPRRGSSSA